MFVKNLSQKSIKNIDNKIVGLKELRNNIETYIKKVHRGESFTVVRRSEPVFRVSPIEEVDGEKGGSWETIVDFSKINKDGVSALDVLKVLKKLNA